MLHWLQAVVDWIFRRRSSLVQLSLSGPTSSKPPLGGRPYTDGPSHNRRWPPEPPKHPYDTDGWVRAPKGHAPTGRCSSVAVAEPVDDESVIAVGTRNRDTALVIHGPGNDGYQTA
jgi:hypothetical protein